MQTIYEAPANITPARVAIKPLPKFIITPYYRVMMTVWLMLFDTSALLISGFLAVWVRERLGKDLQISHYYPLIPMLGIFIIGYMLVRLYPGIGVDPIQEIKKLSQTTSTIMIFATGVFFLTQTGLQYSRFAFLFFWIISLISVPLLRMVARKVGIAFHFWGEPVALIGFGRQGKHIYKYLKENPTYGIRPVVIVNGFDVEEQDENAEILEISCNSLARNRSLLKAAGIKTAILAPNETPEELRNSLVDEQLFGLERLILISSLNWIGDSAVIAHDIGGILGLEVERNLLHLREQMSKRLLDFAIMSIASIIGFPLIALCSILILLDSAGPVFYKQRRVGKDEREIWVWKFRTMVKDADTSLENYLAASSELRSEWEATRKIKHDPRITKIGHLLRMTSLDELPQLFNVLRGEMSLVGPRPIVDDEIKYYRDGYKLYKQVLPGVTGLWQVSGRSDTSYESRVALDEYYIRHWSIWMDIYILIRTVWVVLKRAGAY